MYNYYTRKVAVERNNYNTYELELELELSPCEATLSVLLAGCTTDASDSLPIVRFLKYLSEATFTNFFSSQ
jgi:hypothetical protein